MEIAERLKKIQPSMTLTINNKARQMRADGIKVTSLAVGEPDFATPQFVKDAAIAAINDNFTRYTATAGIPQLRKAAADYYARYYKTPVSPDCMIIGAGGKQCLYTFIQTTINPGDEVLIPSPYWVSYPDMVLLAGGTPVFVPAGPETDYKVRPLMLEDAVTENTRALILNSPCNPTGAVYSDREFMNIMRWALARNIFVISDEIYDQLIFPPAQMTSAITWFEHCPEMVTVVNGLSKSFAMTGWRVGFLAAHPDIIKAMTVLQGHSLSNVCSIAQKAALAALEGPDDFIVMMRKTFEERRDKALKIVRSWKKAVCPTPEGAFYLFPDLSAYYNEKIRGSIELCEYILENAHAAVVPGAAFGNDNCVRISYAVGEAELESALKAMGEALERLE